MDVMTGSDDDAVCPMVLSRGSLQRLVIGLLSSCDAGTLAYLMSSTRLDD
jgi:hypothetical protein